MIDGPKHLQHVPSAPEQETLLGAAVQKLAAHSGMAAAEAKASLERILQEPPDMRLSAADLQPLHAFGTNMRVPKQRPFWRK